MKASYRYLLSLFAVVAVIWRVLGVKMQSYWMDESYSITLAQAIATHGYPLLDSGTVLWRDPVFHYLLAGVVAVFGTAEWAMRFISVIAGVGVVLVLGQLGKAWFSKQVGIIVMMLATFSSWEISWSRQARMYMLLQFLFWLTLLLFERWYTQREKKWYLVSAVVCALLTIGTHQFGVLVIVAIALRIIIDWLFRPERSSRTAVLGYLVVCIGMVAAAMLAVRIFYPHVFAPVQYWSHYTHYLFREHLILLLLAVGGTIVSLSSARRTTTLWLSSLVITTLGIMSFAVTLLQYRYLFVVFPALLMVAAVGIHALWEQKKIRIVLCGIILALVVRGEWVWQPFQTPLLESDPPTATLRYKSFTPQPDFRAAYAWMRENGVTQTITPYPTLTRIYLQHDDAAAIYLDWTGQQPVQTRGTELYTGIPYVDIAGLETAAHTGDGFLLLDDFSRRRLPVELREWIDEHLEQIYEDSSGDWSQLWIYRF